MTADRRPAQSGQIVVLVVLTMGTMAVMAMTAITFGQALVRRHQAQLVVDAAALAGAAEQAKGLNTIARINQRQYELLSAMVIAQNFGVLRGFEDSWSTTNVRIARAACLVCAGNDWAYENWEEYDDQIFEKWNFAISAYVNPAYSPYAKPKRAADLVVNENFSDSDTLFKNETPDSGLVIPLWEALYPERSTKLVQLTEPQDYAIGGARHYKPNSGHYGTYCVEYPFGIPEPVCIFLKNSIRVGYAKENFLLSASAALGNRADFEAGNFYDTPRDRDVRFTYYLRLPAARPVFGADYLEEIPKITVVASAKPYGGHLGEEFEEVWPAARAALFNLTSFGFDQEEGKEISATYRAKLIPVRLVDRLRLAEIAGEGSDDQERFITAFH